MPLAADFGPGPEGRRGGAQLNWEFAFYASRRHVGPGPEAATKACAAGQGIALYASHRLRARPGGGGGGSLSWTGSLLSTPPAVDFGPGPEGATAGRAAGDISFYASRRRLWAWPGGGRRRGAQLDGEFAVYASRRRLRAWPGWGGEGVCCLGPEFAFLSFTHRPLDARPSYARSLVPTPSKTVDQTLSP